MATIRTVLAVAIYKGYKICQMDVKTAFLNGDLNETVHMTIPEGMKVNNGIVCKLKKSLYGLKQSPLCWYKKFYDAAMSMGFTRSQHDYCVYTRNLDEFATYIVLYVDDLLLVGENDSQFNDVKSKLSKMFEMVVSDHFEQFLGIDINYNTKLNTLAMSQKKAIKEVISFLNMEECKGVATPMVKSIEFENNKNEERLQVPYREVIGKVMYIMLCSRPDICYAISKLSRYQESPSILHWQGIKRLVRYLKYSMNMALLYRKGISEKPLIGFVDADYAADEENRKSTSGYLFKVFGNIVTWSSKKQQVVACSTTEAEYVAMSLAVQGVWLRGLLADLLIDVKSITIFEDNQSAIKLAYTLENKRIKHIDVKHHFIREKVDEGVVKIKYVSSEDQEADILTKPLSKQKFAYLVEKLSLIHREGVL